MGKRRMGMLEVPGESRAGLAGKRGPTIFDKIWRTKTVKNRNNEKIWKETKRLLRKGARETVKYAKDL